MAKYIKLALLIAALPLGLCVATAQETHVKSVTDYVVANVRPWLSAPLSWMPSNSRTSRTPI